MSTRSSDVENNQTEYISEIRKEDWDLLSEKAMSIIYSFVLGIFGLYLKSEGTVELKLKIMVGVFVLGFATIVVSWLAPHGHLLHGGSIFVGTLVAVWGMSVAIGHNLWFQYELRLSCIGPVLGCFLFFWRCWSSVRPKLLALWNCLCGCFAGMWQYIRKGGSATWKCLKGCFYGIWKCLSGCCSSSWKGLRGCCSTTWKYVRGTCTFCGGLVKAGCSVNFFRGLFSNTFLQRGEEEAPTIQLT